LRSSHAPGVAAAATPHAAAPSPECVPAPKVSRKLKVSDLMKAIFRPRHQSQLIHGFTGMGLHEPKVGPMAVCTQLAFWRDVMRGRRLWATSVVSMMSPFVEFTMGKDVQVVREPSSSSCYTNIIVVIAINPLFTNVKSNITERNQTLRTLGQNPCIPSTIQSSGLLHLSAAPI